MSFAENLKQIRKEHGYSQEELAELLDVSRQAIGKWENEQGYPEVEKLLLLSKKLNISLDDLMETDFVTQKRKESYITEPSSAEPSPRKILISSPDEKVIINCYKVRSSPHFAVGKKHLNMYYSALMANHSGVTVRLCWAGMPKKKIFAGK